MENELQKLIREKEELERRIMMLTDGKVIMDTVKLDTIKCVCSAQEGKWAVSYNYRHIVRVGRECTLKERSKWVPLFSCENREEAINMIPKVINELNELYEKAIKQED